MEIGKSHIDVIVILFPEVFYRKAIPPPSCHPSSGAKAAFALSPPPPIDAYIGNWDEASCAKPTLRPSATTTNNTPTGYNT